MGFYSRRNSILFAFVLIVLASSLAACNSGFPEQTPTVITELANIESLSLIAIGQTPVKIHASVQGSYPNDCTLVYEIEQEWNDEIYEIVINTKRPVDDENCAQGPIAFEEIYEIPVFRLKAGEYTVDVNGVQEPLVFVFDNE
jgi:hypothetical protein